MPKTNPLHISGTGPAEAKSGEICEMAGLFGGDLAKSVRGGSVIEWWDLLGYVELRAFLRERSDRARIRAEGRAWRNRLYKLGFLAATLFYYCPASKRDDRW